MAANRFGHLFQWSTFGESHGPAMGVVIDGCPAGVDFDRELLQTCLRRRRPGQVTEGQVLVSARNEPDIAEVLSGVYAGKTLGTPIAIMIKNKDARSKDYDQIAQQPRVGHADDVWAGKFSQWDHRGGGRASARETVSRVAAGAVAEMLCRRLVPKIELFAFVDQAGPLALSVEELEAVTLSGVRKSPLLFPASDVKALPQLLEQARESGESYGGAVQLRIQNIPPHLGQPVFAKLKSDFSQAFLSIGACVGSEFGGGRALSAMAGSALHTELQSPQYGGMRGGLSTGEDIFYRCFFKPTSSVGETAKKGRHDPCIVPRAVPVVEAMAWTVVVDHLLWRRLDNVDI